MIVISAVYFHRDNVFNGVDRFQRDNVFGGVDRSRRETSKINSYSRNPTVSRRSRKPRSRSSRCSEMSTSSCRVTSCRLRAEPTQTLGPRQRGALKSDLLTVNLWQVARQSIVLLGASTLLRTCFLLRSIPNMFFCGGVDRLLCCLFVCLLSLWRCRPLACSL